MILAYGLSREYGIDGAEVAAAPLGKPYLPEYPAVHFNYSHCRRGILCGISGGEIGVDIERIVPFKERLAARICHPGELRLFPRAEDKARMLTAVWTAKESYVKYLGTGIRSDLRLLDLSAALEDAALLSDFRMHTCRVAEKEVFLHNMLMEHCGICICCTEPQIAIQKVCVKKDAEGADRIYPVL